MLLSMNTMVRLKDQTHLQQYHHHHISSTESPVAPAQRCKLARQVYAGCWNIAWRNTGGHWHQGAWPSQWWQNMQWARFMSSIRTKQKLWHVILTTTRDAHWRRGTSARRARWWTVMLVPYHQCTTPWSTDPICHQTVLLHAIYHPTVANRYQYICPYIMYSYILVLMYKMKMMKMVIIVIIIIIIVIKAVAGEKQLMYMC